jgi:hypothetical protein
VTATLLDGTQYHVVVALGATVKDVLVALRRQLGLQADSDYSLYLRHRTPDGHDVFTCMPDVLSVEEAMTVIEGETKALVYRRRVYLPPLGEKEAEAAREKARAFAGTDAGMRISGGVGSAGSGGGVYLADTALDVDDVDTEAERATSADAAAHRLAYIEAVYNTVQGYYLLPLPDTIILAGLQLITDKGRLSAAEIAAVNADARGAEGFDWYRSHLPSFLPAQAIGQHKATSGADTDALVVREQPAPVACGVKRLAT